VQSRIVDSRQAAAVFIAATTLLRLVLIPVQQRTLLRDEVGERLRDAILTRELEPGSKLIESRVAQMLGVSRAPLREAICALVEEGLLVAKPFAGYYVQALTIRGVEELYTMRRVLETHAFEHVWPHRNARFRNALARRNAALSAVLKTGDQRAAIEAELKLHSTVFEFCDNELLMTMLRGLTGRLQMYWSFQQHVHGRKGALPDAHDDYVRLATGDDLDAMRAEITDHVARGLVNVIDVLKRAKLNVA